MNKIQKSLLQKNIIEIGGEINNKMCNYVLEALTEFYIKNSPDIYVIITSNGGDATNGLDIFDMLSLYPGKKTAIVRGFARSIACIIVQSCDTRQISPHADVRIHNLITSAIELDVLRNKKKLDLYIKSSEAKMEKIYKVLVKRTGKSMSIIKTECAKNKDMNASESIKFGLIDSIRNDPLPK